LANKSAFTRLTLAVVICSRMPLTTIALSRRVSRSSPRGVAYSTPTSEKPPCEETSPTSWTAARPRPCCCLRRFVIQRGDLDELKTIGNGGVEGVRKGNRKKEKREGPRLCL
jgi:hypothetical protein